MRLSLLKSLLLIPSALGLSIDTSDIKSVCAAAKAIQQGEWNYYEGLIPGGAVGTFVPPYYWWHAGEAFGGLIDYYTFCDPTNETLYGLIADGMYAQTGSQFDYVPSNQSLTEGNDDQGVWGLAIMQAVERNFTDKAHSWLSLTQAVYNTMNSRWDTQTCGGGLRWQIFTWNSGYSYKNSIANGCLFNIAARLARYTGNETYAVTAEKVWDWMVSVNFLNNDTGGLELYDGAQVSTNCSSNYTTTKWSYTYGIVMMGCAYMYDFTEEELWLERTQQLLKASLYFFKNSIMTESACSPNHCNTDQRTFRSLFARSLGLTSILANETSSTIGPYLEKSAAAAAQLCSGGSDGVTCGENWAVSGWDNVFGLGEQMGALEVVLGTLVQQKLVKAPYRADNGGSSTSNPSAGLGTTVEMTSNKITITTKDKAGAGVLTAIVLIILLGGSIWMVL